MRRWPIRVRLAAAYALALLAVLIGVGMLAYTQVRAQLDESLTVSLRTRANALEPLAVRGGAIRAASAGGIEADEAFAQIVSRSGRLLASAGGPRRSILTGPLRSSATSGTVVFDADIEEIEGSSRVLARPAGAAPDAPLIVVAQSLEDRDDTLAGLLAAFAIGGPIAIAVASLIGYLVAGAGLAPVEAMRLRAAAVSLEREELLPLSGADDEIRRLGQTLNGMLARLRDSFERERRFVADASHELRTPVTVLKAEVEAALSVGGYSREVGESLRAALDECDQMAQLTEDLLVLARSGEHGLPLHLEQVRAAELLGGVRQRFRLRAGQQERYIEVASDGDLDLAVDPHRMRQALGNLVDNALRHGEGPVVLSARAGAGEVELAVSDAGRGIDPELATRAFHRFSRGDAARTRGGAGLGLAIVQAIARAHRGYAEIVAGDPATVRIHIPS